MFTPYTHRGPANPWRASPRVTPAEDQSACTVLLRRQSERARGKRRRGRVAEGGRRRVRWAVRPSPPGTRGAPRPFLRCRLQTRAAASRRPRLATPVLARSDPTWICLRSRSSRRRVPGVGRGLCWPPAPLHRAAVRSGKGRGPARRGLWTGRGPHRPVLPALSRDFLSRGSLIVPRVSWQPGQARPPPPPSPVPDEARKPCRLALFQDQKGKGWLAG